ncbi:hypothetical protein BFJ67_g14744, partial [Fusarium oxysporum f. sp. cepae]
MATFTAASIQSAFVEIAEDLHASVQRTSYLVSIIIAIIGGAPFFWRPLSQRYGRRPIFLLSVLCSLIGNVGCAIDLLDSGDRELTAEFLSIIAANLPKTNGMQFILHALFRPETRFLPNHVPQGMSAFRQEYLSFRRIDPTPLRFTEFIDPLRFFAYPIIMVPAASYAMIFLWGAVMLSFKIPQIYPEKFGLSTEQVSLQYVGVIVGT